MGVRHRHIRNRVIELLEANSIEIAPVDVDAVARSLGAEIRRRPTDESTSGFVLRRPERIIIGINSKHSKNRQRFTIAHEIGHVLLHESEQLHVDEAARGFSIHHRDEHSSEGSDVVEREANLFAAELLMPASFLKRDLDNARGVDLLDPKVQLLEEIARRYGVSVQALTFRLANLGYIYL